MHPGCHIGGGVGMLQSGVQDKHAQQANTSTHESWRTTEGTLIALVNIPFK